MHDDDLERLLSDEDEITPSPALLAAVMAALEREAAAPRRTEFPWLLAMPGLLATIAAFAVAIWYGIGALGDPAAIAVLEGEFRHLMALAADLGLQWVMLALAMTTVSVLLPLTLTRSRIGRSQQGT